MSGDWIKIDASTPEKTEVYEIAAACGLTPDDALGKLIRVWIWCDQQSADGGFPRHAHVTLASRINAHVRHDGFAEAMLSTGWLTPSGVPNFERHNGNSAKKRALSAKRSSRYRHAVVTPPSRSERDRVEKIISTNSTNSNNSTGTPRNESKSTPTAKFPQSGMTPQAEARIAATSAQIAEQMASAPHVPTTLPLGATSPSDLLRIAAQQAREATAEQDEPGANG